MTAPNRPDRAPSSLRPNPERRRKPRGTTQRAVAKMHGVVEWFTRGFQVFTGALVGGFGGSALYVVARRAIAHADVNAMDWAFFALGAVMLLAGFGLVIGAPFFAVLGKIAALADDVWDSVRGKPDATP